jgi:hypothetical protein
LIVTGDESGYQAIQDLLVRHFENLIHGIVGLQCVLLYIDTDGTKRFVKKDCPEKGRTQCFVNDALFHDIIHLSAGIHQNVELNSDCTTDYVICLYNAARKMWSVSATPPDIRR